MTDLLQPAAITAQAVFDVASAAAAGALLNRLWLGFYPVPPLAPRLRLTLTLSAVAMVLVLPVELWLLAATMTNSTAAPIVWAALPDVLNTHAGRTLEITFCSAALLMIAALLPAVLRRRALLLGAMGLVTATLLLRTPLGHASSDGDWTLREGVQFLHLVSVAAWGGGILVAGLVTVPALTDAGTALAFGRRLSRTVTVALACVVLSGAYNSWRGLGRSFAPLAHAPWGQILLAKVALVLLALSLGARVRLMLYGKREVSPVARLRRMREWMRFEALTMLAILVISAGLANAPPADAMEGCGLDITRFPALPVSQPFHQKSLPKTAFPGRLIQLNRSLTRPIAGSFDPVL